MVEEQTSACSRQLQNDNTRRWGGSLVQGYCVLLEAVLQRMYEHSCELRSTIFLLYQ
jgi:hypothetical protein